MMCELINETSLTAAIFSGTDQQGEQQYTCVIKAGFEYNVQGECQPLDEVEIIVGDQWQALPGKSSLKFADETVPFKQGAEIIVKGTAYSVQPTTNFDVVLQIQRGEQQWRKALRIFGKRCWQRRGFTLKASEAELFQQLPLRYEHAFGGVNVANAVQRYAANPIGKGFTTKAAIGIELPEIESPPPLIASAMQQVQPAGFGPIPLDWQPRAAALKKISEQSITVPADFYNAAPINQRFTKPFIGGEQITLLGLTKDVESAVKFTLPAVKFSMQLFTAQRHQALLPICDTLVIDADQQQFFMLWRMAINNSEQQYLLLAN